MQVSREGFRWKAWQKVGGGRALLPLSCCQKVLWSLKYMRWESSYWGQLFLGCWGHGQGISNLTPSSCSCSFNKAQQHGRQRTLASWDLLWSAHCFLPQQDWEAWTEIYPGIRIYHMPSSYPGTKAWPDTLQQANTEFVWGRWELSNLAGQFIIF